MEKVRSLEPLDELFDRAKAKDEFEFICTLLRVRGMQSEGWDSLGESWDLINQLLAQIQAPIEQVFKIRLILFLYCHATEMHDLYHIIGNLLLVSLGERYHFEPFAADVRGAKTAATKPSKKVERIRSWSEESGLQAVGELLDYMLIREVRNAFFHSDYVIFGDEFRIVRGEGIKIDNVVTKAIKFEWLLPRLQLGINTVLRVIELVRYHQTSYKEVKILPARILQGGGLEDVELIIDNVHGVVGFRTPTKR